MTYITTQPHESKTIFTITVPCEEYEKHMHRAARLVGEKLSVDGFRPGKAPYEIIKQRIGEEGILSEAFPLIVHDSYLKALHDDDAHPALPPKIAPLRLIPGEPIEYSAEVVYAPTVTLPQLSSILVEKKPVTVSEEDVSRLLKELQKMRIREDGSAPELNDEFAKSLNQAWNLAALKEHIWENLRLEAQENENRRIEEEVIARVVAVAKFSEIADELVEEVYGEIVQEIKGMVRQNSGAFDEYLKKMGKTEDEFLKNCKEAAIKRIKFEAIMTIVAAKEKVSVSEEEIMKEANRYLAQFASVKNAKRALNPEKLTYRVHRALMQKKVIEFLKNSVQITGT